MINALTISYPFDHGSMKTRSVYVSGSDILYLGFAAPGTATSAAAWQIRRISNYTENDPYVDFAGGTNNFDQVWDDYATLDYSYG